jgi:biotin-(acetyl-CoA carboxylase) ligase
LVNQGEVATLRLARGTTAANAIPAWIVIGITVRVALNLPAPGLTPWQTDLAEEGAAISAAALLEGICRHLLAAIDLWNEHGAPGITRAWRAILPLPDTLQPA